MQMCQPHWEQMKQAVKDRGMWHLVARDGKEAVDAAVRQLEGEENASDWDPLMAMNWNFFSAALEYGGLGVMGEDENGNQYCPLCLAKNHGEVPEMDKMWVDGCADAMLGHAREAGLVAREQ